MEDNEDKNTSLTQIIMQLIEIKKPQNVQQLINLVNDKTSIPEAEILEQIVRLNCQGKISLKELPRPTVRKLSAYLKTREAHWYWITLILATAAAISAFTIPEDTYPLIYMRYLLGSVFILWLPGYSFMKALFPREPPIKTSSKSLDSIERVALSIGMSIALVPTVGLLLNYTPWGIRLTPIILSLMTLATVLATVGMIREHELQLMEENKQ